MCYVLSNITNSTYTITALPLQQNVTGTRRFEVDQAGEIRVLDGSAATGESLISFSGANTSKRSSKWFVSNDGGLYTFWGNNWVEYKVDFAEGGWFDLGVIAKNHNNGEDWKLPQGYEFNIDISVDGVSQGKIKVSGSTTEYKLGKMEIPVSAGTHTVSYNWTNDYYKPGSKIDANIEVKEVTFEKIEKDKSNNGKSDQAPGQTGATPGQSGSPPPGQAGTTPN